jgi:ankyrin repeat protein
MTPGGRDRPHLAAIWYIVSELQSLAIGLDVKDPQGWLEIVAGGVSQTRSDLPLPDVWTDQSLRLQLLCGVVLLGIEQLFTRLLERFDDMGSVVNNNPDFFDPPLSLAASHGHTEIVRHLLVLGARLDINARQCKYPNASRFWRSKGHGDDQADFGLQDGYVQHLVFGMEQHTALVAAIQGGHGAIIELFLEHQHRLPTTSLEYFRALVAAAEAGRQDLLDRLFSIIGKSLGDVPALHRFLLCAAARGGHQWLVHSLVDSGIDINGIDSDEGWSTGDEMPAAQQVAALGNISMLRYLTEKGAWAMFPWNVYGCEPQPLDAAAIKGRIEAVHLLLDCGADKQSALSCAVMYDRLPLIKSLLKRYPELLRQDDGYWGRGALCLAVGNLARLETITFLVDAGASLNDGYERPFCTPLNLAKADFNAPMIVIDHLLALGAHSTDSEFVPRRDEITDKFGVIISEASREWTCLY